MHHLPRARRIFAATLAAAFMASAMTPASVTEARAADFEQPPVLDAAGLLGAGALKGDAFTIGATAANDGLMNRYRVVAPFASMDAYGDAMALERAREMMAIAAIRRVKKSDAYVDGVSNAIAAPIEASKALIESPVQTLGNLVSVAEQLVDDTASAVGNVGKDSGRGGDNALIKDLIGYNKVKRALAHELGVDAYSSNALLQRELGDLAWAGFAGNATIDLAISAGTAGGVGAAVSAVKMATASDDLLREKAPTSLTNLNTKHLAAMGVAGEAADAFLFHPHFSIRHQTLMVLSLAALEGVPGRDGYVRLATTAGSENEARFYERTARIMGAFHQQARPVRRVVISSDVAFFEDADGSTVLPLLADYVAWTPRTAAMVSAFPAAGGLRVLWITGAVSAMTRRHLTAAGIAVQEGVFKGRLADRVAAVEPAAPAPAPAPAAARKAPTTPAGAAGNAEKEEPSRLDGVLDLIDSIGQMIPGESQPRKQER